MDLPIEIWLKVALFLSLQDKATSVLVCKGWSEIFVSQLYKSIDLRPKKRDQEETSHLDESLVASLATNCDGNALGEPKPLSMEQIQKYGHFIRELTLCIPGPHIRELPLSVNALLRLHLVSSPKEEEVAYSSLDRTRLARLLAINPQIQHIFFDRLEYEEASKFFYQVADLRIQPQSLDVSGSTFRPRDLMSVLQNDQSLVDLTFTNDDWLCRLSTPSSMPGQEAVPRLSCLTIVRCKTTISNMSSNQVTALLNTASITQLKVVDCELKERELAIILNSWPFFNSLTLECSGFGSYSMKFLGRIFDRLRTLDLTKSVNFLTWMCRIVLGACPLLVDLGMCSLDMNSFMREDKSAGNELSVVDMLQVLNLKVDHVSEHSWACVGLQRFRVTKLAWPDTIERRKQAMNQLLALKRLQHLQFEEVIVLDAKSTTAESDLKIQWKKGDFGRRQLDQDPATAWMTKAWSNLQSFRMMSDSFSTVTSAGMDD